jgi:hypothetical protein
MQLNQISSAVADMLAVRRLAVAEASSLSGSAERDYAVALNEAFEGLSVAWFTIEHNAKGAEAELIHAEKAAFFKVLHEKHHKGKHPNPSTPWARVRKEAADQIKAAVLREAAESGAEIPAELMESAESTGARHRKSLTLAFVSELSPLYRRGRKAEKEGTIQKREAAAFAHIAAALTELGVDLATL